MTAVDSSKTYDGVAFTGGNGVHYTGFVNNETAAILGGSLTYSRTSQNAINANTYTSIPGGITAPNYSIQYINGSLTIEKSPLTIIVNDEKRCINDANPVFTFRYNGWVNGESASAFKILPVANTIATPESAAGSYNIVASGADAANYNIAYIDGVLRVLAPPLSRLSAVADTVLCGPNASLAINASGNYEFKWMQNNVVVPGTLNQLTITTPGVFMAVATDTDGCSSTTNSITVTQQLQPTPDFSFNNYCINTPVEFTNLSNVAASGQVTYTWNSGDNQTCNSTDPAFNYNTAAAYTVSLTATPLACPLLATTVSKVITIEAPLPGVQLAAIDALADVPVTLQARELDDVTYVWSPVTGLASTTANKTVATLGQHQTYSILMTFPSGCVTTDTLAVNVAAGPAILVPNVFSPNGDQQNDVLYVNLRGFKQLRSFQVFNRWGKKVFESTDVKVGWNGTVNRELLPLGTYVWTADAIANDGSVARRQGAVTLLR